MNVVLEHLTEGRALRAVIDVARSVSYPPAETLDSHTGRTAKWIFPVAGGNVPDSQELRDIVVSFVSLSLSQDDRPASSLPAKCL